MFVDFIFVLVVVCEVVVVVVEVILYYWCKGVDVELKFDDMLVIVVDCEVELVICCIFIVVLLEVVIYGEEFGLEGSCDGLLWLVDLLDGIKSFVCCMLFFFI